MRRFRALLVLGLVAAVPFAMIACSARTPYEGGGRDLAGGSTATVTATSNEDTGAPDVPVDTGSVQDQFVPPDTGSKDGGNG